MVTRNYFQASGAELRDWSLAGDRDATNEISRRLSNRVARQRRLAGTRVTRAAVKPPKPARTPEQKHATELRSQAFAMMLAGRRGEGEKVTYKEACELLGVKPAREKVTA